MPTYNVLLHLIETGWREQTADVVADNIRIEGLLSSGAVDNEAEAERIATQELLRYSTPVLSDSLLVDPVDANDTPFISHYEGQTVDLVGTGQSDVESVSFSRDEDGHVTYATELHGHIDTPEERAERRSQKMIDGTFGGVSKVAQPTRPRFEADQFKPALPDAVCCTWAANLTGGSADNINPSGSLVVDANSPQNDIEGMLFPSDSGLVGILPAGIVHISGYIDVEFVTEPTVGGWVVAQQLISEEGDPIDAAGWVRGKGYVIPGVNLTVDFSGDILFDDDWNPGITVVNFTDAVITQVGVWYTAHGVECSCVHGATAPGS